MAVSVSVPPFCWGGDNFQSQIFKWGDQKKMSAWGTENVPIINICLGGWFTVFLIKKDFLK